MLKRRWRATGGATSSGRPPWWATEAQPGRVGARELGEHRPRERVRGQVVASRRRRTEACEGRPFVGPENLARARGEDGRVTAS